MNKLMSILCATLLFSHYAFGMDQQDQTTQANITQFLLLYEHLQKAQEDTPRIKQDIETCKTSCQSLRKTTIQTVSSLTSAADELLITFGTQYGEIQSYVITNNLLPEGQQANLKAIAQQPTLWINKMQQAIGTISDIEAKILAAQELIKTAQTTEPAKHRRHGAAPTTTMTTTATNVLGDDATTVAPAVTPPTQWQGTLPQMTEKPTTSWWGRVCNRIWPQLPTLEVTPQQVTIDATQNTAAQVTEAAQKLDLAPDLKAANAFEQEMKRMGRKSSHYAQGMRKLQQDLETAKSNPATALPLILAARNQNLLETYRAYEPAKLIASISNARAWRLSLAAVIGLGTIGQRTLTKMRFYHPTSLAAAGALVGYCALKPVLNRICTWDLQWFDNAKIENITAARDDYKKFIVPSPFGPAYH